MHTKHLARLALLVVLGVPSASRAEVLALSPFSGPIAETKFPDRVVALCHDVDHIPNRVATEKAKRTTRIVLKIKQLQHRHPKVSTCPTEAPRVKVVTGPTANLQSTPLPQTTTAEETVPVEETAGPSLEPEDDPSEPDSESVVEAIQNTFSAARGKLGLCDYSGASGFALSLLLFAVVSGGALFYVRGR